MGEQPANSDKVIAKIAGQQHGVVSTAQLRSAGVGRNATSVRVRTGRLHRLHRSVYAVGHALLSFEGRCMAAVLALGAEAVASHRSAGALWRMLPPHDGAIDVTIPGGGGREKRKGIRVHRSATVSAGCVTRRNGIAITNPARTLHDL